MPSVCSQITIELSATLKRSSRVLCIATALLLAGCEAGYYWQAVTGHVGLMNNARPLEAVIADPATTAQRQARLREAQSAVDFAHRELGLPDNGSYRAYAQLDAPYVVWNVVATPALSLEPLSWCFPVAGCVSYRGYFDAQDAEAFARELEADGYDVHVGGAIAYSTLGRFDDPLLSSMLELPETRLAGVVFHELAHQQLYVRDDSAFNEGFASFVEAEGLRRWLEARGDAQGLCDWQRERSRQQRVIALLDEFRHALDSVYSRDLDAAASMLAKQALLATIGPAYARLSADWPPPRRSDAWFSSPFNNARLALFATYDDAVPAFAALLAEAGGDLAAFYALAAELGGLPGDERRERLAALEASAPRAMPGAPCQS